MADRSFFTTRNRVFVKLSKNGKQCLPAVIHVDALDLAWFNSQNDQSIMKECVDLLKENMHLALPQNDQKNKQLSKHASKYQQVQVNGRCLKLTLELKVAEPVMSLLSFDDSNLPFVAGRTHRGGMHGNILLDHTLHIWMNKADDSDRPLTRPRVNRLTERSDVEAETCSGERSGINSG
jgi:hypothetical protein